MTRRVALALALLLAGCQANLAAVVKAKASAAPTSTASKAPVKAAPPVLLGKPAGAVGVLSGRVAMEPGYAVGLKAGQLIGNDGAGVLAANASLISQDGGGLITNDGGSLISNDGGGIVAQGAGNVIAPAALISQDGGSLIGNDGGGLITNDGGSLVAKARRLLATDATTDQVPAAGMALYARNLATRKPVPLGQDKDGKPVYAVYTNLKGDYELYLPAEQVANVEVVAFVPGKADPRLRVNQVAAPTGAGVPVDDTTTTILAYIRFGFRQVALALLTGENAQVTKLANVGQAAQSAGILEVLKGLTQQVRDAGINKITDEAERQRLADAVTDVVLGRAHLDEVAPNLLYTTPLASGALPPLGPGDQTFTPKGTTAIAILSELLAQRRQQLKPFFAQPGTAAKLAGLSLVQLSNARDKTTYTFKRPSDYDTFVAAAIVGPQVGNLPAVRADIQAFTNDAGFPHLWGGQEWFSAAFDGLEHQLALALFVDADVAADLKDLFARAAKP